MVKDFLPPEPACNAAAIFHSKPDASRVVSLCLREFLRRNAATYDSLDLVLHTVQCAIRLHRMRADKENDGAGIGVVNGIGVSLVCQSISFPQCLKEPRASSAPKHREQNVNRPTIGV